MNILFLTEQFPYPLHDGGNLRTFHILKGLCEHHNVTMVSHAAADNPDEAIAALSELCEVVAVKEPSVSRRVMSNLIRNRFRPPLFVIKNASDAILNVADQLISQRNFDAIHMNMLDTAFFALKRPWQVPLVFDSHNCLAQIAEGVRDRARNPFRRVVFARESRALRRCESEVASRMNLTLVCSNNDARLFSDIADNAHCIVAPNGVDSDFFSPSDLETNPDQLVFTGSMSYFPNEEGALWFAHQVLPLLKTKRPSVCVDLVGRTPPASLQKLHDGRSINVTGTVADVRPFVHRASVFIVPLQTGGGTRLKILEAFSMGKAVVSTSKGAEGIPVEHGHQILIADSPAEFATAIEELMASPEKRAEMGHAARRLVEECFDWKSVQEKVHQGYQQLSDARVPRDQKSIPLVNK